MHRPETYDSLFKVMARSRKFENIEHVLEEMSTAVYELSNNTCIELITSCVNYQWLKEAFSLIQIMRKFKFLPAFLAYTTLIGAFAGAHEPGHALTLFQQMQEIGYEVNMQSFTTLIRVFTRDVQVDAQPNVITYTTMITSLGKAGNIEEANKLIERFKAGGNILDSA